MRKYIWIMNALETAAKLAQGKRVKGVLYIDENTGKLCFNAYNIKPYVRRDRVVCELENGWLKEGTLRYKLYISVRKALGRRLINLVMHRELNQAMEVLEVEELLDNV